ncbi:hypothetical protein C8R43DRAFT_174656 [Mycena crocata]|nr:hypothetical protein C8R43DRAFT_174656 [Mycena crocata]
MGFPPPFSFHSFVDGQTPSPLTASSHTDGSFSTGFTTETAPSTPFFSSAAVVAGTLFGTTTIGSPTSEYAAATSVAMESSHLSKGPIVAAAVGASIAACLVLLAGVLFCLRSRARTIAFEGVADTARRCTDLEKQLLALGEQVTRLEAQQQAQARATGVQYMNEKDPDALEKLVADPRRTRDSLPTYMD